MIDLMDGFPTLVLTLLSTIPSKKLNLRRTIILTIHNTNVNGEIEKVVDTLKFFDIQSLYSTASFISPDHSIDIELIRNSMPHHINRSLLALTRFQDEIIEFLEEMARGRSRATDLLSKKRRQQDPRSFWV
jgi:hypothetical protein